MIVSPLDDQYDVLSKMSNDLVWIVLSCQATQAERPDSLTQSKPNQHMVLLHSAQHFLSDGGMNQLNF